MARASLLGLLLLGALFAGCVGGDEDVSAAQLKNRAQVSERAGGIQGVVTDPAIQPVVGATVTILETSATSTTASDGSYAFSNVLPGTYTLSFAAAGFIAAELPVEVRSGRVSTVDAILAQLPTEMPFQHQLELGGFVECSATARWGVPDPVLGFAGLGVAVCALPNAVLTDVTGGGNVTNDRFLFNLAPIPVNPWQAVAELQWEASQPLGELMSVRFEPLGLPNDENTEWGSAAGESPIVITTSRERIVEADENMRRVCDGEADPQTAISAARESYCLPPYAEEGGPLQVRVFVSWADLTGQGIGAGASVQQEISLIMTSFHNAPACPDYSVYLGNECPQLELPPGFDPNAMAP